MNRRQNHSNLCGLSLQNEILGSRRTRCINICFAGVKGSGKSTLARRFKDIDQDAYDDSFQARKKNIYNVPINLDSRRKVKEGGKVILKIYIERERRNLRWVPICLNAELISLIVFCLDVNDLDNFYKTRECINRYREFLEENMPAIIVVGTKIDIRDDPDRDISENVVRTRFAKRETKEWQVTRYCECSAWQNEGVDTLMDFILNLVL